MADRLLDVSTFLYEREAEQAYERRLEIDRAARWCRNNYPHKFEFLNVIYRLLVADERSLSKFGFADSLRRGIVRARPVLAALTPSQALRLLEAYKREHSHDLSVWHLKDIEDIERRQAQNRYDSTIAALRDEYRVRCQNS